MKKIVKGVVGLAVASATAVIGGGYVASSTISIGERQTQAAAMEWQSEHYDTSFYGKLEKRDYQITSYDGYVINATLCKNPKGGNRYVILSHGHSDTKLGCLKYMPIYLDLGFNCIIYDLRGHGDNEKTYCTYGLREGRDLYQIICDTRRRYGEDIFIGLHGESLGSATTISSLTYFPDVSFVVADCGFSDLENVLTGVLAKVHVPAVVEKITSFFAKIRFGNYYEDMRPIESLPQNLVPIMFIHGEDDDFISPMNSEEMSMITAGYSEIHMIPGAGHAESVLKDPEAYRSYVTGFVTKAIKGKI